MRFDKHTCSSSCGSICWVSDRRCGLSTAWVAFSEVLAAVCAPVVAQVVVSWGFLVVIVVIVGDDVAMAVGGSGCERRGWGDSRGAVDRFGTVCRHF